jgi:HTH-type transcriptional regulator, glycine betaine synthesis regulator
MAASPSTVSADLSAARSQELESEIITFWVQVSALLSYPRSVGEIFGLIFVSETPLNADDVARRLGMSRSGAGQGLKALQDIGAIKPAHQLASRKEHYQMQTDLGVLVKLLLNARVLPKLQELSRQRAALDTAARAQGSAHLVQRFEKLARWRGKTAPVLALLTSLAAD